jgi:hypothetical protein
MARFLHSPAPLMHHVFVDGENVHQIDARFLHGKRVSITLLLGKTSKLDAGALQELMGRAGTVQLVRLSSTGNNALDITLAYYVGRAVLADPSVTIHVVSKDKDFDPLIQHLQERGIKARRHEDFSSLSGGGSPAKPSGAALADRILAHLRDDSKNRPRNRKALTNKLLNAGLKMTEAEIAGTIHGLCADGRLTFDENNTVQYHL